MIIYGKSGVTFAKDLFFGEGEGKTTDWEKAKEEGMKLVEDYLNTFSGLKEWLNNTKKSAYKKGYVETMFGRRRRLPDLKSSIHYIRADAERQAINAPIQGTGSDFTLRSIIEIMDWLEKSNMKSRLVGTVHDSLVFDIYIPEMHIVAPKVKHIMEHVHEPYIDTPVPIKADMELGDSYGGVFDVELEEVQAIHTKADFEDWLHTKKVEKYTKEIEFFKKKGKPVKELLDYMARNNRPIEELKNKIVEIYSKKE